MGNDGGSIPKRRELVKEAARNKTTTEMKESQAEQQEYYWTTDPITNEPLEAPIVSDCNGRLYKKESVLKVLTGDESINKDEAEKATAGAIKTLKDVIEVKFEADATSNGEKAANGEKKHQWICPITNKPLGPGSRAVYLVPCGHAFSSAAIKEVADEKCLQCGEAYAPNDVIPIVPTNEEDVARLVLRMKTLKDKGLTHSLKKGKKRKAREIEEAVNGEDKVPKLVPVSKQNGSGTSTPAAGNGIKNSATASLAAKVLEEQERKKRKTDKNESLKGLFSSRDQTGNMKNSRDFMTRGFTMQK
jgi:hypothetical protein